MSLIRWSPDRVRPNEAPELVASRNFGSLSPVLEKYAAQMEENTGVIDGLVAKLKKLAWPAIQGLSVRVGVNSRAGSAVLVAGTILVNNASVTAGTLIYTSRATVGGTLGHLSYTKVAGTSFTINSSSATDTSTVNWFMIEPF